MNQNPYTIHCCDPFTKTFSSESEKYPSFADAKADLLKRGWVQLENGLWICYECSKQINSIDPENVVVVQFATQQVSKSCDRRDVVIDCQKGVWYHGKMVIQIGNGLVRADVGVYDKTNTAHLETMLSQVVAAKAS